MAGWIKIDRDIINHWIWSDFRKQHWWFDLLINAAWQDTDILVLGRKVKVKRGEQIASANMLANKWGCDRKTVTSFLKMLQKEDMIMVNTLDNQITIVTICNYETYQGTDDEALDNQTDNQLDNQLDNFKRNKEVKKIKKELSKESKKESAASAASLSKAIETFEARKEDFYNSLTVYVPVYGKEMVRAFFDYWTEPNKSKSRMRYEQERTWDTNLRIQNWARRENIPKTNLSYAANRTNSTEARLRRQRDAAELVAELLAEG